MVTKPTDAAGTLLLQRTARLRDCSGSQPAYDGSFEFEGWPIVAVAKAPLPDVDCNGVANSQYEVVTTQGDFGPAVDATDPASFWIALFR